MSRPPRTPMWLLWLLLAMLCGLVLYGIVTASPARAADNLDDVTVIAHRGASGVQPENTVAAIRAAVARGVRHVEMDFRCTSSGTIVAAHDAKWDRQSTGTGNVADRPWSYVKRQYARRLGVAWKYLAKRKRHERHPHLARVLREVEAHGLTLHVDMKTRDCERKTLRVLQAAHDRGVSIVFGAHTDEQRQLALDITRLPLSTSHVTVPEPEVDTMAEAEALVEEETADEPTTRGDPRIRWLSARHSAITPELVRAAHDAGMLVRVWTFRREDRYVPDEYANMREWVAQLHAETGFDAIITDNVDERHHGIPLP